MAPSFIFQVCCSYFCFCPHIASPTISEFFPIPLLGLLWFLRTGITWWFRTISRLNILNSITSASSLWLYIHRVWEWGEQSLAFISLPQVVTFCALVPQNECACFPRPKTMTIGGYKFFIRKYQWRIFLTNKEADKVNAFKFIKSSFRNM